MKKILLVAISLVLAMIAFFGCQGGVIEVTSIVLNKSEMVLELGKSEVLVATLAPGDATVKAVLWESSNLAVATVDVLGKVTAISEGEATITAKTDKVSATCIVLVQSIVSIVESFKATHAIILGKTVETVTLDDRGDLNLAFIAYEKLSAEIKTKLAAEHDLLMDLDEKISVLENSEAMVFKANHANILEKTIDTITLEDRKKLDLALADYEQLPFEVKILLEAESELLSDLTTKIEELEVFASVTAFKTEHADILAKTVDTVTISDRANLTLAGTAFRKLSKAAQDKLQTQKARLKELDVKITTLEKQAADNLVKANAYKTKYATILGKTVDTIAISDKDNLGLALAEYNNFSTGVKMLLTTENTLLTNLNNKIIELENILANNKAIANEFKLTHETILSKTAENIMLEDKQSLVLAETAYNLLSSEVKALLETEKAKLDVLRAKVNTMFEVGTSEELLNIVNSSPSQSIIYLKNGTYNVNLVLSKSLTLIGKGTDTVIAPSSGNAILIGDGVSLKVEKITITVLNAGRAISTKESSGELKDSKIHLLNSTINYEKTGRGISLGSDDNTYNNTIIVENSSIVWNATSKGSSSATRGISIYGSKTSTVTILNSNISAGHYAFYAQSEALEVNISDSTLKGYAAVYLYDNDNIIRAENSKFIGVAQLAFQSNGFGTITLDSSTSGHKFYFTNSIITNEFTNTATSEEILLDIRGQHIEIYLDLATQLINTSPRYVVYPIDISQENSLLYINNIVQPYIKGASIYVDSENGSDDEFMSGARNIRGVYIAIPFKTISEALQNASENSAILLRNGTYTEDITIRNNLTLKGESKDKVIIIGNISIAKGFATNGNKIIKDLTISPLINANAISINDDNNLIVENVTINVLGSGSGIKTSNADGHLNNTNISLINSTINYCKNGSGIEVGKAWENGVENVQSTKNNVVVKGSKILWNEQNKGSNSDVGGGISIWYSTESTLDIDKSEITAGHYALKLLSNGLQVKINDSKAVGLAAITIYFTTTGVNIDATNSTFVGRTYWGGEDNAYGAIAMESSTNNITMKLTNCILTNEFVADASSNEILLYILGKNIKIYLDSATQLINTNIVNAPKPINILDASSKLFIDDIEQAA